MRPELTSLVYGSMLTQCHLGSSGTASKSLETVAIVLIAAYEDSTGARALKGI